MVRIAIFDYGAGNLFSLMSSIKRNGCNDVTVIRDMKNLDSYDGLVLPGVGNFDPAIKSIHSDRKLFLKAVNDKMPILGICLGMEMLFDRSEEGTLEGLKILNGDVVMLPSKKVKIPHMGWNNLEIKNRNSRLLDGIEDGSWVYFVHSYRISAKSKKMISATSKYGIKVPAAIEKGNLFGTQFHPEKSGRVGAIMIKNFIQICAEKK